MVENCQRVRETQATIGDEENQSVDAVSASSSSKFSDSAYSRSAACEKEEEDSQDEEQNSDSQSSSCEEDSMINKAVDSSFEEEAIHKNATISDSQ